MAPLTLAFDLDGTLVDTAPDLLGALNFVLGEQGLAPIHEDRLRALVGAGARVMIERGLAIHQVPAGAADVDRMLEDFLRFYRGHIADHSRPFPGVAETLDLLAGHGHTLVVVTNKYERYSVQLLDTLNLARYFAVIAGPDTYGVRKPEPGHLLRAVEQAGGEAARTIMIGDSITDMATAREAGVPAIAVSFGYRDGSIESLGADAVVDHFHEIPASIERLAGQPAR